MQQPLLGSDIVIQIGILVNDIEKASQDYADFLGVPMPEIKWTGEYESARTEYMGNPTRARTKQSFFDVGPNIQIELLEPDMEPSTWRHDLETKGEGIHHLAFQVKGMKKCVDICEERGMKLVQKGEWATGRYAYLDATELLKTTLELLEFDNK